ncbi:MAG: hypothetical protein ABJO02_00490 [Reichenbachiella sp.]|uniref:hypothetical protein n=1 Tax=Reichenbachiella sp. TaxID=2184521 RepID=UPI003298B054
MNTHADKTQVNKSQSVSAASSLIQSRGKATFQFVDNRPEAVAQRKLQELANSKDENSSRLFNNKSAFQRNQIPNQPSGSDSTAVIQLFVQKRTSETGWKYFSSLDPDKLFNSEEEAFRHDLELLHGLPAPHQGESQADRTNRMIATRHPTLYTYMTSGSNTKVENRNQGPHSVSHVHVAQALSQINTYHGLTDFFHNEIPNPDRCRSIVQSELGKEPIGDMRHRHERFMYDYTNLYSQIIHLLGGRETVSLELLRESISRIVEMNPYTTYSWRSGRPAGSKAISGKGESRNADFDSSVDQKGKWKSPEAYNRFVNGRRALHRGDYAHQEEYNGPEEGGFDDINQVIEAAMRREINVGDRIVLNPVGELVVQAIYLITDSDGFITGARVRLRPRGG